MKKLLPLLFVGFFLISCQSDIVEPSIFIYQVENRNGITIPVTVEDYNDGTGFVFGNLLFDNIETEFSAIFDYVSDDGTNFNLFVNGDQLNSTFVSATGFYASDYIEIFIYRRVGGLDIEEVFLGSR